MTRVLSALLGLLTAFGVLAEQNQIDIVRHDAPDLAYFGEYDIGVRTLRFSNPNQVDILHSSDTKTVRYSRQLTVEVWYPAELDDEQQPGGSYVTTTRNLSITATLHGRAVRNAKANSSFGPMPLLIISHGYPGNRYLMSHMAENLASKGYVVASIDHRDSTYEDQITEWSSLYHRPLDQLFVIDEISLISTVKGHFLNGIVDTDTVGIVGYSVGGYGLLVNMGAGYTDAIVAAAANNLPGDIATRHAASNPNFPTSGDTRIKAGLAIAPYGMNVGMWDEERLSKITRPLFLMAGTADETVVYESGVRPLFESATHSDRYLLTFLNAGHNAIAPIPLPVEFHESEDQAGAFHYTDAVWDSVRSSNVMIHFATAFFDYQLKNDESRLPFLDLVTNSKDGVWSVEDGEPTDSHTYWLGFPRWSARGLLLEHQHPAN